MKYTPEKYEWETGDVVCSNEYFQAAIRTSHNTWTNTLNGNMREYTDEYVTSLVKKGVWKYLGGRFNND